MFTLDITEMREKTCSVTSHIPQLMKLDVAPENSEVIANKATNKASSTETDGSMSPGTRHTATDVKENEPNKCHKPSVVFIGQSEHEWPELLPQFVGLGYYHGGKTDPETVLSAPEFATVGYYGMLPRKRSGENHDNTDNAILPESRENPARKDTGLTEEIPSKRDDEPGWLKNAEDGTPGQIDPADTRNHTTNHLERTDKCVEGVKGCDANQIVHVNYSSNGNNEDLMCANHPIGIGYWRQEDDNGVCIGYHEDLHWSISDMTPQISSTRDDTALHPTRVKEAKNKRMAEAVIDENVFCLAGKNQSGPVSGIMYLYILTSVRDQSVLVFVVPPTSNAFLRLGENVSRVRCQNNLTPSGE